MSRTSTGWKIYKRGINYWVWWADGSGGKVRRRLFDSTGAPLGKKTSAAEAQRAAAAAYDEYLRMAQGGPQGQTEELTLDRLQRMYCEAHVAEWDRRTVYDMALCVRTVERFFGSDRDPRMISAHNAEEFKQWLLREGRHDGGALAPVTASNRYGYAVSLFKWGREMELLASNPFKKVKQIRARPVRVRQPFSPEETTRILRTCQAEFPWLYPLVLTAAVTGSRRGPLPLMEVRDFDAVRGILVARDEISKRRKGQVYHLPAPVVQVLARAASGRRPEERLFVDEAGKPLNDKSFDRASKPEKPPRCRVWFRLLKAAGIPYRGIHDLRRGVVSNLVTANITIDQVTSVTGHTAEVARSAYLNIDGASQRRTMETLLEMYAPNDEGRTEGIILQLSSGEAEILTQVIEDRLEKEASNNAIPEDSGTHSGTTADADAGNINDINDSEKLAVEVGFEPTIPSRVYPLSRRAPSTTRPPHRRH